MDAYHVPLIIRGEIIEDQDLTFAGRRGGVGFTTPDVRKHLDRLALNPPSALADLYTLSFADIRDYLDELSNRLTLRQNPYLQAAFEAACVVNGMTAPILRRVYENMHRAFARATVDQSVKGIGVAYLDGWVAETLPNGSTVSVRAFGARAVHIIAGNVPTVAANSIMQSTLTRSDIIVKTPSNDPLTAAAIARTAILMAPDHPITRHMTVAYWKGGDQAVEERLYRPENIEKIIAWGGLASITHIAKYIQPGIDLITLDPKLSTSMVGREAFAHDDALHDAARRLAIDIGARNQEACHSARVIYVESGLDAAGLARANRFGQLVYDAIQALPEHLSTQAKTANNALLEEVDAVKLMRGPHKVFGGGLKGAVIVSQTSEPVDFARILADRVANLVPVDSLDEALKFVNAYTQTIGVYPDERRLELRDRLVFHGGQRIVSLGYAAQFASIGPHDGIEPLRRMCKWVVDEHYTPDTIPLASMV